MFKCFFSLLNLLFSQPTNWNLFVRFFYWTIVIDIILFACVFLFKIFSYSSILNGITKVAWKSFAGLIHFHHFVCVCLSLLMFEDLSLAYLYSFFIYFGKMLVAHSKKKNWWWWSIWNLFSLFCNFNFNYFRFNFIDNELNIKFELTTTTHTHTHTQMMMMMINTCGIYWQLNRRWSTMI